MPANITDFEAPHESQRTQPHSPHHHEIEARAVSAEVTINVANGIDIASMIGTTSAEDLKLKVGAKAFAVIKASSVMVGVDHA